MNITLCSAFRNSVPTLQRYLSQCADLDTALYHAGHRLSFVWGEGDSTDGTLKMLQAAKWRFKADVVDASHGGPAFGSVVSAQRFKQLAHVGNVIFRAIPADAAVVVWVESDLIWEPATMLGLIKSIGRVTTIVGDRRIAAINPSTRPGDIDVIAPPILLDRPGWGRAVSWYDTLAFTRKGQHFEHPKPWHPDNDDKSLLELDTAGSCLVMRAEYARGIEFDERVLMGACEQIRAKGGSVWFDPSLLPIIHQ